MKFKFWKQIILILLSIPFAASIFLFPPNTHAIVTFDSPTFYNVRSTAQEPFVLVQPTAIDRLVFNAGCLELSVKSGSDALQKYLPREFGGDGALIVKTVRGSSAVRVIISQFNPNDFKLKDFTACLKEKIDALADIVKSSGSIELLPAVFRVETIVQERHNWPLALLILIVAFSTFNLILVAMEVYRKQS